MRRPIVAANWKMHKTTAESREFGERIASLLGPDAPAEIVVAPPFTSLSALGRALAGTPVSLAGQNMHSAPAGAFTGEVSAAMLVDAGCTYVILGHSERRTLFGESDAFVAEKLAAAQANGLRPIVCIGESLEERESERTESVLAAQIEGSLATLDEARAADLVLAYEPIWAIGTGRTATPELAQAAHAFVRRQLEKRLGAAAAAQVRIQYGGSVKPENAAELLAQPDIDGALVGGASLDPESFAQIVRFSGGKG